MKKLILLFIVIFLSAVIGYFYLNTDSNQTSSTTETIISPTPINVFTDFTATFSITTNGTVRTFTNPDYHNLSEDVYIEASNPNTINVTRSGVKWNDFFTSLPFSLSKDCLTTGTGQTFCTDESGTLKFFINGTENPDALDLEIMPNDNLEVVYE